MSTSSSTSASAEITGLLERWSRGDGDALGRLMPMVYTQLRRLASRTMRSERRDHTLQTTALVHEAFLRFAGMSAPGWADRRHFYCVAAQLMRHTLVDHARGARTERRGGGWRKITLGELESARNSPVDLLELDEALEELARLDARKARVVELRFFCGLSVEETAEVLSVSKPTVVLDTRLARAWLYSRIRGAGVG
jgi:RNA polymerase sigma factor (TIGR02999 family)